MTRAPNVEGHGVARHTISLERVRISEPRCAELELQKERVQGGVDPFDAQGGSVLVKNNIIQMLDSKWRI